MSQGFVGDGRYDVCDPDLMRNCKERRRYRECSFLFLFFFLSFEDFEGGMRKARGLAEE